MSLLQQIQEAAIDSSIDLPALLRKCKVLAWRLKSAPFERWVDSELGGYQRIEELPDYRIIKVFSKGHFSGPFGSSLQNADIPLNCIPEKYREHLNKSYLTEPIAAVEILARKSKGNAQEPWDPNLVAYVGQGIYKGMNCLQAWKVIPATALIGAVDAVRTRVLNFVLKIESESEVAGEPGARAAVEPERVTQIFNTYISGNVQNLASGSTGVTQAASKVEGVQAAVLLQLMETLRSAQVPTDAREELEVCVNGMQENVGSENFLSYYQRFMGVLADHIQVLGPVVAPYLPQLAAMVA